ncbi:hypothetical protein [Aurantiacibacter suaedae]|uniref:hypothetical protein n=1 Tax=Aurantiacibacter suaedae TaxID=2545755 RepID=UPI0013874724|nr:hypothetical protein [Aurantiacibacter suaedae]
MDAKQAIAHDNFPVLDYDPPITQQAPCQFLFGAEIQSDPEAAAAMRQPFAGNRQFFAAPPEKPWPIAVLECDTTPRAAGAPLCPT